jgi:purine-binding chemotaxis protein CheW
VRALLVPVGADTYAIALDEVREVLPAPVVTTVPTAPPSVMGVFNLRGEVVALLDTGTLLGVGLATDLAAVVVVDAAGGIAGLSATASTSSVELGERVGDSRAPGTRGRFRVADSIATLLDLTAVLDGAGGRTS